MLGLAVEDALGVSVEFSERNALRTTGVVAGALAGLLYGADSIPAEWTSELARAKNSSAERRS